MRWVILFLFPLAGFSYTAKHHVYINSGEILIENRFTPAYLFNFKPTFDTVEALIQINQNDTLELSLTNNLSLKQNIVFLQLNETFELAPNQTKKIVVLPNISNAITFFSDDKTAKYMGLSSAIIYRKPNSKTFVWNLREYEHQLNKLIKNGNEISFDEYVPDIFTINSLTHSIYKNNKMAEVMGHVGDSLYIHILNSGLMFHSVHFHGYHVKIMASNMQNLMLGWDKDSFPIKPGELIEVLLVPHQPGMYPVHDHNLKSVTIGGNYPGGMVAMLKIMP